jgi:hypothetical protein
LGKINDLELKEGGCVGFGRLFIGDREELLEYRAESLPA